MQIMPGYWLVERLGGGGFGEVWSAETEGRFKVALKLVALGDAAERIELRSLEAIRNIRHPHLISVFGAWRVESFLVIAMELAERTLYSRLLEAREQGLPGIPPCELMEYMEEASKGLDFLNGSTHGAESSHPQAVQHRDVKPQNLLLVGGSVKVADFGLARVLNHTFTGHTGGMTLSYAAPEFFREETTSRSDQYSLAVTYCQLRGGRLPFKGGPAAVMAGHLTGEPDLTMLPEAERLVVARSLAKEARSRFPSCRDFVRALVATGATSEIPPTLRAQPGWITTDRPSWPGSEPVDHRTWDDSFLTAGSSVSDRAVPRPAGGSPESASGSGRWASEPSGRTAPDLAPSDSTAASAFTRTPSTSRRRRLQTIAFAGSPILALGCLLGVHRGDIWSAPHGIGVGQFTNDPTPDPWVKGPIPPVDSAGNIIVGARKPAPVANAGGQNPGEVTVIPQPSPAAQPSVGEVAQPIPPAQPPMAWVAPPPLVPGGAPHFADEDPAEKDPNWEGVQDPLRFVGHKARVNDARFSRDGLRALSGSSDGTLRLWMLKTGRHWILRNFDAKVLAVAFSSDERLAIAALDDQSVAAIDLSTGGTRSVRKAAEPPLPKVVRAYLPPRGDHALFVASDGSAMVCDIPSGANPREFRPSADRVPPRHAALSPDGKLALFVIASDPRAIIAWDIEGGKLRGRLTGHGEPVSYIGFSGDGRRALSGGEDGKSYAWDFTRGKPLVDATFSRGPLDLDLDASGNDRYLAAVSAAGLFEIHDIPQDFLHQVDPLPASDAAGHRPTAAACIRQSPDGLFSLSGHSDGDLWLWRMER